jgi:hypothetical protein
MRPPQAATAEPRSGAGRRGHLLTSRLLLRKTQSTRSRRKGSPVSRRRSPINPNHLSNRVRSPRGTHSRGIQRCPNRTQYEGVTPQSGTPRGFRARSLLLQERAPVRRRCEQLRVVPSWRLVGIGGDNRIQARSDCGRRPRGTSTPIAPPCARCVPIELAPDDPLRMDPPAASAAHRLAPPADLDPARAPRASACEIVDHDRGSAAPGQVARLPRSLELVCPAPGPRPAGQPAALRAGSAGHAAAGTPGAAQQAGS